MPFRIVLNLQIAGSEVERFPEQAKRFVNVSFLGEQQSQLIESFRNLRMVPDFQAPLSDPVILAGLVFAFKARVIRQQAL